MKRICAFLFTLVALLNIIPNASAIVGSSFSVKLDESGNGRYRNVSAKEVQVTLDGAVLNLDMPAFVYNGDVMVPAQEVADKLGAVVRCFAGGNEMFIRLDGCTIRLKNGSNQARVNGKNVTLCNGISAVTAKYKNSKCIMVPLQFIAEQLNAEFIWSEEEKIAKILTVDATPATIVVDAGHGGKDGGAVYEDVCEKDINLMVAKRLKAILESCGYNVIMTRDDDTFIKLTERAQIANEANADIFVSLHSNVLVDYPDYSGTYTYYYWKTNGSKDLAKAVQTEVCDTTNSVDRGVLYGDLSVLRNTTMSAALIEMGFMTCHEELEKLVTPDYQNKLAEGVAQGIINYLNEK